MFVNLKGEDLKAYSELDQSINPSHHPMSNPKQRIPIRMRYEDDKTCKDSFLDKLENLSNFSKFDKTPQSKFKPKSRFNNKNNRATNRFSHETRHRGSVFAPKNSSSFAKNKSASRGASSRMIGRDKPEVIAKEIDRNNNFMGSGSSSRQQMISIFSKYNQSSENADPLSRVETPCSSLQSGPQFVFGEKKKTENMESELNQSVEEDKKFEPGSMIKELDDENIPASGAVTGRRNKSIIKGLDSALGLGKKGSINEYMFSFKGQTDREEEDEKGINPEPKKLGSGLLSSNRSLESGDRQDQAMHSSRRSQKLPKRNSDSKNSIHAKSERRNFELYLDFIFWHDFCYMNYN